AYGTRARPNAILDGASAPGGPPAADPAAHPAPDRRRRRPQLARATTAPAAAALPTAPAGAVPTSRLAPQMPSHRPAAASATSAVEGAPGAFDGRQRRKAAGQERRQHQAG